MSIIHSKMDRQPVEGGLIKPAGQRELLIKCFGPSSFFTMIRTIAELVFPAIQAFRAYMQQKLT